MSTIEVAFRDPGSSSETEDELLSKIEHKFTEICCKEGWILDGIIIRSKPRRQGQEASVEEKEQTFHSTQRKCPKCGKLWGKRMFNRHDCNPQTVPDELNCSRCSNQPIADQTSGFVSKTPGGPQPSTNECQNSVLYPHMTYTHVELETSTTEISEKLKICEGKLQAIEEMLVCSICWEVVQGPHTLVCGHTYCTHCIWKWEQHQKHDGRKPWCPQCSILFNSTRLLLDNSRGAKIKLELYPKTLMLGQVTEVISDKLSTSEEPGGGSRFQVLDGDQAASSSSGVVDDEMEETESILGPLLGSIVFLYVYMSIFTYMFSSWQRPGTSPSK